MSAKNEYKFFEAVEKKFRQSNTIYYLGSGFA